MQLIWHTLMNYVWAVLTVVGLIIGALLWIGMAAIDAIRRLFRHEPRN